MKTILALDTGSMQVPTLEKNLKSEAVLQEGVWESFFGDWAGIKYIFDGKAGDVDK